MKGSEVAQLDQSLAGRVALITGGTGGINFGIARRLRAAGAAVAVLGRNAEKARAAAEALDPTLERAAPLAADVRDFAALEKAVRSIVERFGQLDIVIAGAAGNFVTPANQISAGGFKAVVDIDLLGTFNIFRAAYEHLRRPGASLIAITAGQAVHAMPGQSHVCAAKAGVNMLTRCLALEWGSEGIRVNGISPGPIDGTEGLRRLIPTEELRQGLLHSIPLRRYGTPEDIAELAYFLCSAQASYVTGAILDCDGGAHLGSSAAPAVV